MARRIFAPQPTAMARIPLRPAYGSEASELLDEGVFLASRAASQASRSTTPRAAATLRAYDIRSRCRSTPHGVFSGVAVARFAGGPALLRLDTEHRVTTSPRPHWLATVADQLLDHPGVLAELHLWANNLVRRRADRLEAEHPGPGGAVQKTSIRATPVSLWLLDACTTPTTGRDAIAGLLQRHPQATEEAAVTALRHMVRGGLLLSDLLPEDPRDDALGHILGRLPSGTPAYGALARLRELLHRADSYPPGHPKRLPLLREASEATDTLHHTKRPLAADTIAQATITLPERLAHDAARAADLLWRVGQLSPAAADYHQRFLDRYGPHRMVPLLEALDPATGIGLPEDDDTMSTARDITPGRAATLAHLLGNSVARGGSEVALDDALVQQLTHSDTAPPPRTAEIHVRVLRTPGGDFALAVCPEGGSQDAGSASGRFARWLPQLAPQHQPAADGPLIAEIVCRPRTDKAGGLAVETGFAPHRIPVGVPARPTDLPLRDLLLTSNGRHLVLWSAHHGRQVVPVLFNRLAPDLLPPTARLLQLLGHAGERPWHPWSWGAAGYAPFTPRVRYRNVILSPARWKLPADLTQHARNQARWEDALHTWRTTARPTPPGTVHIEESDRHLPVDLDHPTDRELLRRSVTRGARAVTEPLGSPGHDPTVLPGPHGSHILDLTVRLTRCAPGVDRPRAPRAAARPPGAGCFLPGSEWLSASIPAPFDHHDAILRRLPALLQGHKEVIRRWFFLRYQTPALGPHLRIRFNGAVITLCGVLLPALSTWCGALREQQLAGAMALEPYEQEVERYGGTRAITAAEAVFTADSEFTLGAMAEFPALDDRLLLAAASAAETACFTPDPHHALRGPALSAAGRRRRDHLRPRLRSRRNDPAQLARFRAVRTEALRAYLTTLTPEFGALCASDLIHMHCNRILGPHIDAEAIVRSLATDLVHRHAHD